VRWRIRQRTFAHAYMAEPGRHAVYAAAARSDEPFCVVTFRAPGDELQGLLSAGWPFFRAAWGTDVVTLVLDDDTDWAEAAEVLADSYCVMAPKRLAARVVLP
jgi:hypothetical protein